LRHRLAGLGIEELAEQVERVEMHAGVCAALPGERTDLRFAAVVEELDAERLLEIAAQRRRQGLGGGEPDPIEEVTPRIEPDLARRIAEIGEEARRSREHRRAPGLRQLHLQAAVAGPALQ